MAKLLYVVPDLGEPGGIQRFAIDQTDRLSPDLQVELLGWPRSNASRLLIGARRSLGTQPDLVHHWHMRSTPFFRGPARKCVVVTCHGLEVQEQNVYGSRKTRAQIAAIRDVEAITVPSHYTKALMVDGLGFPDEQVQVIPPGVIVPVEPPRRSRSGPLRVGTLTRLVERKNIAAVIDALALLCEQGLDLEYQLAGDGPLREDLLERLRRSGVPHTYWGAIDDDAKLEKFYPSLDVFVLTTIASPTDVEGFGIVYLEANAAGVPVVGSIVGGVGDAIADGTSGKSADPLDPADIARAISEVAQEPDHYGEGARTWVQGFSREATAARFEQLYRSILPRS